MKVLAISFLYFFTFSIFAQNIEFITDTNYIFLQNESYGPYDRNVFDIILPKSGQPTALIIFIHGGGFQAGDKSESFRRLTGDISYFVKNNIAFASINYRFYKSDDSSGVNKCLDDVKTAIQYIRFNSLKYNIKKESVACYGASAGAGSCLYLAFHDDFAIKNDTTLLGESTRIICAGAIGTQSTYNLLMWKKFIPTFRFALFCNRKKMNKTIANFYGYQTYNNFKLSKDSIAEQLDMLGMITPDDPPVYIMNLQKTWISKELEMYYHHRRHAIILSKYLKRQNVEFVMFIRNNKIKKVKDIRHSLREFMVEHLK